MEARAENDMNALEWADWRNRTETAKLLRKAMGFTGADEEDEEGAVAAADAAAVGQYAMMLAASKKGRRVVVRSGKRKGLVLYTDAAGKIMKASQDTGYAIGRPSNAGVCHLKNKQCRYPGCTLTAYWGDSFDMIRRFCREHRREDDIDVKEKGQPVPDWGGSLPLPWQL
uniref:Uncharacterized protein n=1 Tax=Hemiselmis andersenii TaxID=464988 RepID=A0A7S1MYZ4_HEMAN